jgi:pyruvate kinase
MRRAKIVCTLGPASSSPERLRELIDAGMDVARFNFSHGDYKTHETNLKNLREQATLAGRSVAALLDLQGPKIRVGKFEDGEIRLKRGDHFVITTDTSVQGNKDRVSTTYSGIVGDVNVGDQILLDDGFLSLRVADVTKTEVHTVVEDGGTLKNNKGINLPSVAVSAPALTAKDKEDLAFGLTLNVDYIALSFVRAPEDVLEARRLATVGEVSIPIIAKIEKPQAVDCIDAIIAVSDGIMVARGDLGVEMGPEKVPLAQKKIIRATNDAGKIVITATQMLESMIQHARPTRAEASDVANAILDNTDALMLSGETAVGHDPVNVVETMSRIIGEIESSEEFRNEVETRHLNLKVSANAVAHAAVVAARQINIGTIAVVTDSGGAARLMSEYRPKANIVAFTSDEVVYRRLALYWGVTPVWMEATMTQEELYENVEQEILARGFAQPGDPIIITSAVPVGCGAQTNQMKIHHISL